MKNTCSFCYRDDILDFRHPAISNFQDVIANEFREILNVNDHR